MPLVSSSPRSSSEGLSCLVDKSEGSKTNGMDWPASRLFVTGALFVNVVVSKVALPIRLRSKAWNSGSYSKSLASSSLSGLPRSIGSSSTMCDS